MPTRKHGALYTFFNELEESFIAITLALMTLITFANVVVRYVFNSNLLWALELTVFLFAWLILIGMSYCLKVVAHLGVDLLAQSLAPKARKTMTLIAVAACVIYCVLLLKGGWDYWYKFASTASFLEVNDIPMPDFLQFLSSSMNDGEAYEKVPRFIPYMALPIGLALLLFRFLELGWYVLKDEQELIIASHEAEDMIEEAAAAASANDDKTGENR
jgi:C4-dicarboxylate transporter DctQ subunit